MLFQFSLLRARINEIFGRTNIAFLIMSESVAPPRWAPLREVYALRLKVLSSPMADGEKIMRGVKVGEWATRPTWNEEQYALIYVEYLGAGVAGDGNKRENLARFLKSILISNTYRKALFVD